MHAAGHRHAKPGLPHRSGGTQAPPGSTGLQKVAINAGVQPYLQFFPSPNGQISGDTGSWSFPSKSVSVENLYTGRMDYTLSQNDAIHATVLQDGSSDSQPDGYDFVLEGLQPLRRIFTVSEAHTFSPTLVNFARFGYNFDSVVSPSSNTPVNPLATNDQYGFVPGYPIGELAVTGLTSFFGGVNTEGVYIYHYNDYQAGDDVYFTKGKHSLQAGFSYEAIQSNDRGTETAGYYVFSSYANFLGNAPKALHPRLPARTHPRICGRRCYGAYLQDAYHVRRNLTFNLGVRYEPTSSITTPDGHLSILPTDTAALPSWAAA